MSAPAWSPFLLDSLVRVAVQAERSPLTDRWASGFRHLGQAEVYLTVVIGLLVAGRMLRRSRLTTLGRRAAYTLIIVGLVGNSLKFAVGRVRPGFSQSPREFRPFDGPSSFPSGHTGAAFALAGSLALESVPPVGVVLLLAASGTGWSRINDNKHWLTDVLAGALFAVVIAGQVRRIDRRRGDGPLAPEGVAAPRSAISPPAGSVNRVEPMVRWGSAAALRRVALRTFRAVETTAP